MGRRNRITIKDIAEEAGVSIQTVSRVLNKRKDVSADTRRRVKKIISKHGYRPSSIARGMAKGRSYILGVVGMGLLHYGPASIVMGVERQANALGYTLMLNLVHRPEEINVRQLLRTFQSQHVDGIVWGVPDIGEYREILLEELKQFDMPLVAVSMRAHPRMCTVDVDNLKGGELATQHLIEQGRRTVGLISGPKQWWAARQRASGWECALEKAGQSPEASLVVEGDWTAESGEQGLLKLMEAHPELDGLFAANDQMALGAINAARQLGRRIPQDLAIVGYDGISEARYFYPPLTTVYQDIQQLGRQAVQEIDLTAEASQTDEIITPKTYTFQPELIVRESSVSP